MKYLVSAFVVALGCIPNCSFAVLTEESKSQSIDFTKPAEARQKSTWFNPDAIRVTGKGLGWEGHVNDSYDAWIETQPMAVGASGQPPHDVWIRVVIGRVPAHGPNTGGPGSLYVRYRPDKQHWSTWQALSFEPPKDKLAATCTFTGRVDVPLREREEYLRLMDEYRQLNIPSAGDEETLSAWIVKRQPDFFRDHKPYIAYVQFLYETSLNGGEHITRLDARTSYFVGGLLSWPLGDPRRTKVKVLEP
jgi:hypothetical protein